MTTVDEFMALIRDELGLPVSTDDVGRGFDELPGWDSVYLLRLLTVLERETGRALSMPDVLDATSLGSVYELVVAA